MSAEMTARISLSRSFTRHVANENLHGTQADGRNENGPPKRAA